MLRLLPCVVLLLLLVHDPTSVLVAAASPSDAQYEACKADPACSRLYHQFPPNRQVFDRLYELGAAMPGADDTTALRARAAELRPCPLNERYFVDSATSKGVCRCPEEEDGSVEAAEVTCGQVTPFHNNIIYAACVLSTTAIVIHVAHALLGSSATAAAP